MYPRAETSMTKRDILGLVKNYTDELPELTELSMRMNKSDLIRATNTAFARADAARAARETSARIEAEADQPKYYAAKVVGLLILVALVMWLVL